jgi:polysaccharide export outer membrane protein
LRRNVIVSAVVLATFLLRPIRGYCQSESTPESDEFVLGIEDKLSISVCKEPDLSKSVSIRPDGRSHSRSSAMCRARTDAEAAHADLSSCSDGSSKSRSCRRRGRNQQLRVFVLGEVSLQGALNLKRRTRLLEAIALAGGMSKFADKSNLLLLRFEDGKETRTRIDYRKVVSGEKPELNVYLKPGDTIIVN